MKYWPTGFLYYSSILVFLFSTSQGFSQNTIKLSVKVITGLERIIVPTANVSIYDASNLEIIDDKTLDDGLVVFQKLEIPISGTLTIKITKEGYYPFEKAIQVSELESSREVISCRLTPFRPGLIRGMIKDESGEPLEGVLVKLDHPQRSTISNEDGEYEIKISEKELQELLRLENYKLHHKKKGYKVELIQSTMESLRVDCKDSREITLEKKERVHAISVSGGISTYFHSRLISEYRDSTANNFSFNIWGHFGRWSLGTGVFVPYSMTTIDTFHNAPGNTTLLFTTYKVSPKYSFLGRFHCLNRPYGDSGSPFKLFVEYSFSAVLAGKPSTFAKRDPIIVTIHPETDKNFLIHYAGVGFGYSLSSFVGEVVFKVNSYRLQREGYSFNPFGDPERTSVTSRFNNFTIGVNIHYLF